MKLESPLLRLSRAALAALAVGALHWGLFSWALGARADMEESQTGGAFILELADVTASPQDEEREIALGRRSDQVAEVAASVPEQAIAAQEAPIKDEPPAPEAAAAPDEALQKRQDETPRDEAAAHANNAPQAQAVAASEAAALRRIEGAQQVSDTSRGQNVGLSRIDLRAIENWQRDLVVHLNRHKRYPAATAGARPRGIVLVAFSIDQSGHVLRANIARTSGSGILDEAAIDMLKRADPLPIPPPAAERQKLDLVVPVNFR